MTITIDTYRQDFLPQITARYNAETEGELHVAPLTPERFVDLVERKSSFDPTGLFVAREGGEVVGWAHACCAPGSEAWNAAGLHPQLRMLIYPRERLEVGKALMAEAMAWLERASEADLLALHAQAGYPFYRGLWYGGEPMGPASMVHVQLALEVGGYRNTQESVFMTAEVLSPPKVPAVPGLALGTAAVEWAHEGMRESWVGFAPMRTEARLADEVAGSIGWVVLPHVAERLGAPCLSIWSLGVAEARRRRGIASALLAEALRQGYAQGARFASVATQLWNAPAQATYAKFGFRPHRLLIGRTRKRPGVAKG